MASSNKRPRGWRLDKQLQDDVGVTNTQNCGNEHSCLATLLLNLWSKGALSATSMQKIAYAAILDGAEHVELGNLAKCGNFGLVPGNVARDVHATFLPSICLAPSVSLQVPVLDPKTSQMDHEEIHFFLPHMMFWSLMLHYPEEANIMFAIDKIPEFWDGVVSVNCPKLQNHPLKDVAHFSRKYIPLFIHGDGVEYTNKDSLMTYSWGALLSAIGSQDSSILLATFPKSCTWQTKSMPIKDSTWGPVLDWIRWSFQSLFEGVHPSCDPEGKTFPEESMFAKLANQPLCASQLRCVVWTLEGDQDYFCNVLKLNHWATPTPCWSCDVLSGDPIKCWKKLKPLQQGWVVKDAAQAEATLRSDHPFFGIPGVTTLMIGQDGLHILFCKGVLSYCFGSVLHLWCWRAKGRQQNRPTDVLAGVFSQIQDVYKELRTPTRCTNLRLSMFTNPDKPHAEWAFLKLKGAETKHILKPLALIAENVCKTSNLEVDHRVSACLAAMDKLVDALDAAGMFLTEDQHAEVKALSILFFWALLMAQFLGCGQ